jgi:hypothetical protein
MAWRSFIDRLLKNVVSIGDGTAGDKVLEAYIGAPSDPCIRWNNTDFRWDISDGAIVEPLGIGGVSGVLLISSTNRVRYSTISAAINNASSGDLILVGPGTYAESFTIPAGVVVNGAGTSLTFITGAGATGDRIYLENGSTIQNVRVTCPTDASYAITGPSLSFERATISDVHLLGASPLGKGVLFDGGILSTVNTTFVGGPIDTVFDVADGYGLFVRSTVFSGTISKVWRVGSAHLIGTSFAIIQGFDVTDAFYLEYGAIVVCGSLAFESPETGIRIADNNINCQINVGHVRGQAYDVIVESGVTDGTLHLQALEMDENRISISAEFIDNADFVILFQNERPQSTGSYIWGDLSVGHPLIGSRSSIGQGAAFTKGIKVFTTDDTAGAVADGGNFIDVTTIAISPTLSTFTFQGKGANHTILATIDLDGLDGRAQHVGWDVLIETASDTSATYIAEVWTGAIWEEVVVMYYSAIEGYSYANNGFIRANSHEKIHASLELLPVWATKTINGIDGYWSRIRIISPATTLPTIQQLKLEASNMSINTLGIVEAHGVARWRKTIQSGGNIFGESGGVASTTINVGSGGLPTGWAHSIKNSRLNGVGDAIYTQLTIPRGICTSCPLIFRINYSLVGAQPLTVNPVMIVSAIPIEISGVNVADPTGGRVPVPRTEANTETLTGKAGTVIYSGAITESSDNKIHQEETDGLRIDSYYEGDMVAIRIELDDDGTPNQDIVIWNIDVAGVMWTLGERIV